MQTGKHRKKPEVTTSWAPSSDKVGKTSKQELGLMFTRPHLYSWAPSADKVGKTSKQGLVLIFFHLQQQQARAETAPRPSVLCCSFFLILARQTRTADRQTQELSTGTQARAAATQHKQPHPASHSALSQSAKMMPGKRSWCWNKKFATQRTGQR
jgi:hypothetical protein